MRTIALIYVLAAAILITPTCSHAFTDYDVDWPTSISGKEHTLRIVIDGCTTLFKIEHKNLEKFTNDQNAKKEVVMKAIERTQNNCKD